MKRLWEILEPAGTGDRASRAFDFFILTLIAANVVAVVVESVVTIRERWGAWLEGFENFSMAVFVIEYLARLASCTSDPRYRGLLRGRIRFAATPMAVIDFLVILPALVPLVTGDMRCIRALRLLRILRLAKLARYVEAIRCFGNVFKRSREELLITTVLMALLLVMSSSLMYQVEHEVQPENFPNVPATMWWAVATLTTVGYGDVYPVTAMGRLLGAFVAVLGIGFFALPTGILGSGFVEEVQRRKRHTSCPHCGEPLD